MNALLSSFNAAPRAVLRQAELAMIQYRTKPCLMRDAVAAALEEAVGAAPPPSGATAAGQAIARAVAAYSQSFTGGSEPAYHNQYHQAEATRAMGWLCAAGRRLGLLTSQQAAAGVLAMAGHDLLHDGSCPGGGVLEARSADATADLGAAAGLDATVLTAIRRVIMSTDRLRSPEEKDQDDLLCRLAQEADLAASLTPELGWRLGQALAEELRAAGCQTVPSPDSFAGRLLLLQGHRPATPPGHALGLDDTVADQLSALKAFGDGDAGRGAARLDKLPAAEARARYLATLTK